MREMCIPAVGFEPSIPTSERPKTYALDRAAAGVGHHLDLFIKYAIIWALFRYPIKSVTNSFTRCMLLAFFLLISRKAITCMSNVLNTHYEIQF